ncbi:MAG: response regulator, partial [bacterium]|nr:response regulator [bacterium]
MSFRFFVVDDDVAVRRMLGSIIQQAKLGVVVGESGLAEEALLAICEKIADVVLVDLLLPDMDGIELIR